MKILLIGTTGFVGHHAAKILSTKFSIVAAGRKGSNIESWDGSTTGLQAKKLDLAAWDSATWLKAICGCEAVINCAAYGVNYDEQDPVLADSINAQAPARLFALCAERDIHYIHLGTSYEYGAYDDAISERTTLKPVGVYGTSKARGSEALLDYKDRCGGNLTILRLFGMYGPRERKHKLLPLVFSTLSRKIPLLLSSGAPVRDYLYVEDAISAIEAALRKGDASPSVYNVCSGSGLSIRQFVEEAVRSFGEEAESDLLKWGSRPDRPDELMSNVGDPSRARQYLNWTATTSLQQGLAQTARQWRNAP